MARRGAPTSQWPSLGQAPAEPGAAQRLRLIVRRPNLPEVRLPLNRARFSIGRATQGVDLTLEDELVSRQHAEITVNPQGYVTLRDLGSVNGVQFGGRTVRQLNLNDGDEFQIGETTLRFCAELRRFQTPAATTAPRPAVEEVVIPDPAQASAVHPSGSFERELARASDIPDPEEADDGTEEGEAPDDPREAPEAQTP